MMFPFLWQIKLAFSSNAEIQAVPPDLLPKGLEWSNFTEVFERLPFLDQFWVSVAVTLGRTVGSSSCARWPATRSRGCRSGSRASCSR